MAAAAGLAAAARAAQLAQLCQRRALEQRLAAAVEQASLAQQPARTAASTAADIEASTESAGGGSGERRDRPAPPPAAHALPRPTAPRPPRRARPLSTGAISAQIAPLPTHAAKPHSSAVRKSVPVIANRATRSDIITLGTVVPKVTVGPVVLRRRGAETTVLRACHDRIGHEIVSSRGCSVRSGGVRSVSGSGQGFWENATVRPPISVAHETEWALLWARAPFAAAGKAPVGPPGGGGVLTCPGARVDRLPDRKR